MMRHRATAVAITSSSGVAHSVWGFLDEAFGDLELADREKVLEEQGLL